MSRREWLVESKAKSEGFWYEWGECGTRAEALREAYKLAKARDLWPGTKVRVRSRRVVYGKPIPVLG